MFSGMFSGVYAAPGMPVYGATKFGVVGFTLHMAVSIILKIVHLKNEFRNYYYIVVVP